MSFVSKIYPDKADGPRTAEQLKISPHAQHQFKVRAPRRCVFHVNVNSPPLGDFLFFFLMPNIRCNARSSNPTASLRPGLAPPPACATRRRKDPPRSFPTSSALRKAARLTTLSGRRRRASRSQRANRTGSWRTNGFTPRCTSEAPRLRVVNNTAR